MNNQASDIARLWEDSAPYWEKYRAIIEQMFAPLTSALIKEAHIASGQKILDVAGGTGEPSLTIAKVAGPSGSVTYTDLVPGMVESARAEGAKRGLTNIQFHQCPADSLPFLDNSFDAAVSRLGVMFFPDPVAGVREMLRVVGPGGYVSFVVWAPNEVNPFFHVVTRVMERYVEAPPEDPDAPGAFRFALPGKLSAILDRAGASEVTERVIDFRIDAAIPLEQFWTLRVELSDSLREKVAKLEAQQVSRVIKEVEESASEFFANGAMSFPARALIVSGTKRGH